MLKKIRGTENIDVEYEDIVLVGFFTHSYTANAARA